MFSSKSIVILIGNNGTYISKHDGKNHEYLEFIERLNDEIKAKLIGVFNNLKDYSVYILLDTIDQTYKKKTYPKMRSFDLEKIINRDLASDGDKEGLKGYIILDNKRNSSNKKSILKKTETTINKSDCLFITSSKSEIITEWLNFIYELPNRLIGIYMLPVESFSFFKKIVDVGQVLKNQSILKIKSNNIFCLVIQTKAGGARQIVFSNSSIVFTRVVNYNFAENNFYEKYSQDIYSTFEYLKRLYVDLTIKEFEVINIFPDSANQLIAQNKNIELNISSHTIQNALDALKLSNVKATDDFFDLLMSSVFIGSKKILKFTNKRIKTTESFYFIIMGSYVFSSILVLSLFFISYLVVSTNQDISDKIDKAQIQKIEALNQLAKIKKTSLQGTLSEGGVETSIERVGDMGRVEEGLGKIIPDFIKTYSLMAFSNQFNLKFNFFSYTLVSFNSHNKSNVSAQKQITLIGKLYNKSGDIEDLFTEFDKYLVELKKSLVDYEIKYNELPRNIDFNQKYYDFPIEFRIISKK